MQRDLEVIVIGSGFAGLCMGVQLRRAGIDDMLILEQDAEIGGTWRANHYPGCACDVPSHLYSYSFFQNAGWSRRFPSQAELLDYTLSVVREFGLAPLIRTSTALLRADFDEAAGRWRLQTSQGDYSARVLVLGTGALNRPQIPALPGLENFAGRVFHSAAWDHGHDLAGRRVAVIGSGASAVQFVPELARQAAQLDVYQRSAPWILPRPDRAIRPAERWLLARVRPLQQLYRLGLYLQYESRALAFVHFPALARRVEALALAHLRRQIPGDPALRDRLRPDYRLGCKRVLLSNAYYPALARPNVELVTAGIREVRAASIVDQDGREREVDTIVFGTGFSIASAFSAIAIHGRGGARLGGEGSEIPPAYKGASMHGFPNLFMITGPNTGLGHNSMIYMIESGVAYALDAIRRLRSGGWHSVEVRAEAQRDYNGWLARRLAGTVWATGCRSWYLDSRGRNGVLWPGFSFSYRWITRHFDAERYELRRPP
jgi:cyclohexanone monooxygenase